MSDYIKREDAIDALYGYGKSAQDIIKIIPAADVVERKHGKWEFSPKHPIAACSVCGGTKAGKLSPFCPWCGAEMDTSQIYLNLESGDSDV